MRQPWTTEQPLTTEALGKYEMSRERQLLIAEKMRLRARSIRVSELSRCWADLGVNVSFLSDDEQRLWRSQYSRTAYSEEVVYDSLQSILSGLYDHPQTVIITAIGSRPEAEPAVVTDSSSLAMPEATLRMIYPDGFVVWDEQQSKGLEIDFDEHGFKASLKSPAYRS